MIEPSDQLAVGFVVLVVAGIVGWTLVRDRLGESLQGLGKWLLIAGAAGFALLFLPEILEETAPPGPMGAGSAVEIARGNDGHYATTLTINGEAVRFLVDTGAGPVLMTVPDAERVGVNTAALDFGQVVNTANGPMRVAQARVEDVRLGDDIVDPVLFVVVGEGEAGANLLGMDYLSRFREVTFEGGTLRLVR